MNRILLALSLIGAIATAQAEPSNQPPMDAQQRSTHLQKTLQLNNEQTAKVKTIFESDEQQRQALMTKYKPQLDAFHAEQKTQHEQTHKQLSGVLTPKQLQTLEQQCEGHHKMHGDMMAPKDSDEHDAPAAK